MTLARALNGLKILQTNRNIIFFQRFPSNNHKRFINKCLEFAKEKVSISDDHKK